jgi:hypothetical protein
LLLFFGELTKGDFYMKIRLSKRLLSAFLAILMVVTSVPMLALTAFADVVADVNADLTANTTHVSNDDLKDEKVAAVVLSMQKFENKLAEDNKAFTNVTPAYTAYVNCQKGLDAYLFGGESNALDGLADTLDARVAEIGEFTGYTGTAVPTFPASTVNNMKEYLGVGFNNVLYAPQAISTGTSNVTGGVATQIYYSSSPVLLWDGTNDTLLPVMMSANCVASSDAYNKERYIYSGYPTKSSSDNSDSELVELVGYWMSGNDTQANWNWNWWSSMSNGVNSKAGYNYATGVEGSLSTSYRSGQLAKTTRSGYAWNYQYTAGASLFMSNVLRIKSLPSTTEVVTTITPTWYMCTSKDATGTDPKTLTSSVGIKIINYSILTDAISTAGQKMKTISLDTYSQGGLATYISALDTATTLDPNSYFTNGDGTTACSQAITNAKTAVENASTDTALKASEDNADYQTLRSAMTNAIREKYAAGSEGYTTDSWQRFEDAYKAVQSVMADVNDNGYSSDTSNFDALAEELTTAAASLVTNITRVDTQALEILIEAFSSWTNIFTDESYNSVLSVVDSAKAAVWEDSKYGVDTAKPTDSEEAQALVEQQRANVEAALKTLRISFDTSAVLDKGTYSLNKAVALADNVDPIDYSNYSVFSSAILEAQEYMTNVTKDSYEFGDYSTEVEAYNAVVKAVIDGYYALERSFTRLEDGTIIKTGSQSSITQLAMHKNSSGYNWYIDFSYPSSAVVFKTTHSAKTVTYGSAELTYKINIDNNIDKENNSLDSITINGTADANDEINSDDWTSTPKALSDSQKSTYTGSLTNGNFSLANFVISKNLNNRKTYYGVLSDGTQVTQRTPSNDEYATILATTDGSGNNPATGCIALQPVEKGDATIGLTADMNFTIPANDGGEVTGSATDQVTKKTYSMDSYFGATIVWNTQPTLSYAGYAYLTSKSNDEKVSTYVTVIDISYLVDLTSQCNALLSQENKYTASTWATFTKALEAAQANMDYTNSKYDADTILSLCQQRYTNLYNALQALTFKTFDLTFNYPTTDGTQTSTKTITVNYQYADNLAGVVDDGSTYEGYLTQFNSIDAPETYVLDNKTYTFEGWSPDLSLTDRVDSSQTYTAVYSWVWNKANFDAYNTAKAKLLGLLVDEQFSVSQLNEIATSLSDLTYFTYSDTQKDSTLADVQSLINNETAKLNDLITNFPTPCTFDLSTAKAVDATIEAAKQNKTDIDMYDLSALNFDYTQEVKVATDENGADINVVGLIYDSEDALDEAIRDALNNMQINTYSVQLNGEVVAGLENVPYGTTVTVNSDGTIADGYSGDNAAWSYSYDAPSREGAGATTPKYIATVPSYTFTVKGNTYLTAVDVEDESSNVFCVTVKSSTGKIIDVATTNGTYTMPNAPLYANYSFAGYSNGATAGEEITVTADVTIIANYDATAADKIHIDVYDSMGNYFDDCWGEFEAPDDSIDADYNELVTLSSDDAFCWVIASFNMDDYLASYQVIYYGSDYSFYACQEYVASDADSGYKALVPLTRDEYDTLIDEQSTVNSYSGAVTFVSSNENTLYDGEGNPILAKAEGTLGNYTKVLPDPVVTVSSLDTVKPIYNGDALAKLRMTGTFTIPDGYQIVECGFLVSLDTDLEDITVEDVASNDNVYRLKSSRYTVGNQFVINLSGATEFNYRPYVIVKDDSGNLSPCYYGETYSVNF